MLSRTTMHFGRMAFAAALCFIVVGLLYWATKPVVRYILDKKGLRRYPGLNAACGITNLGFIWEACRGHRTLKLHRAHEKHPVVRLGPNSLSFNDLRAVKDIYGHSTSCIKDEVYTVIQGPAPHVLDVVNKEDHTRKRRGLANAFAQRNVETWEYKVADKVSRLIQRFDDYCGSDEVIDFRKWTNLFTVEAIADIGLSLRLGFLEKGDDLVPVRQPDGSTAYYNFIQSLHGGNAAGARVAWETDWFSTVVKAGKLFSPWFKDQLNHGDRFGHIIKTLVQQRLHLHRRGEKLDDFFHSLVADRNGLDRNLDLPEIEAEVTVMMNAGSDTTAIQLTNVMYHLLKNPRKMAELRRELDTALQHESGVVPYSSVRRLPYLRACLDEALRVSPPVAFGLPRRTPPGGALIAETWVAGEVTVCIPAYVAHRDEKMFPQPEEYLPERWLAEDAPKLQSAFIPFSAGARGCIGRNISYIEQYVLLATLLTRYNFSLSSQDWQLETREDFNLLPGKMPLRIRRRDR